ncbi:UDP-N-acetylmuramoyl-L-alanyl-D-glutamate--2,6-diaminopimelate ligase [Siminovitchia terrae]|uniref:UDP-N-acetylmuramoyl-L-alanyl-D-glutamate--2,6-diaminopimelate ligase n=1 Tax=Siminovitchia terrae TaxID=1914933 RepID=A0ABQ4KSM9_SIMTE|nr:UDP-N-acetylmuramoyl-L-alanyl-D-glutamate--2,6-diaminopimelate ligase [Siminovitchia terrae]GIN91463.1 UDP-N-acetylmuramoyl-L-alanyl-D-glutamate--2,6-diaminopimelate ligase [Siminovitchia terrae]GIN94601.1 UDP-N-acetylmuramoyl-L-alanyl-D-glutamate--2,6-diaminopimelate ligase [Siminovitchia terrae]
MKLHTLLKALPLVKPTLENTEITAIVNDHRKVEPGSMFICIKGHRVDGHDFAKEAAEKGAAAIVSEKPLPLSVPIVVVKDTKHAMAVLADVFYGHPTEKMRLVGITGTNGKTTTSFMVEEIFREANLATGLIGTISMKIGDRVIETKNTTPDTIVLQETFAEMVSEGVDAAVMEVSSHALVQGRVDGCDFDVAVFTNLSQDHLDYHQTMEEYKKAKGLLFTKLGNTYTKPKFAVINVDDPAGKQYIFDTSAHVVTYGIDHSADFMAQNIVMGRSGTSFTLISPEGKNNVSLKLMGKFSVYNTLAAIAAAYVSNVPLDSIIRTVEAVQGVPGRFEGVDEGQDFSVIVDYAHTPDSLENVLKTIKEFAGKRIFAVVGCGGDRDRTKRPLMAEAACKYATDPIFTSDNPRTEDPIAILKDMEKGVEGKQYQVISDRKQAITAAINAAREGDVVLIAGKGHETYQIIGDKVFDFDDRLVASNAIKELRKC